jgi:aspartate carbamoyltransferase catalytic subunit
MGGRHLLSLEHTPKEDIQTILDLAKQFEHDYLNHTVTPSLKNKMVITLFYEASTRTRSSFDVAIRRLSGSVMHFAPNISGVVKGESLKDTVQTFNQMNPDFYIIRHSSSGAAEYISKLTDAHVVNAGDGAHEHPTQALLDLYTIWSKRKKLSGLNVTIVGDILRSRVARSNMWAMKTMGMNVTLCGPAGMVTDHFKTFGVTVTHDMSEAIHDADVIMLLRIQKERMQTAMLSSVTEYIKHYGLTNDMLVGAKPDVLIMHPGPINRGIELTDEITELPNTVILDQVRNGVFVRMAVLHMLLERDSHGVSY